jgi:hypothetical protein
VNYQLLLDKEQSTLRENTLSSLKHGSETNRRIPYSNDERVDFLLCPSCFWCASYFNYGEVATRCPTCGNDNVESLPISNGEFYTFSHNRNRGITLEFSNKGDILK